LDSGIYSGIEKFCLRRKTTLIGVAPEHQIKYPRIAQKDNRATNELTNGHTHFVLIGENQDEMKAQNKAANLYYWNDEAQLKVDLAKRIAAGRTKKAGPNPCRIVMVVIGDNVCYGEIELAIKANIPIVVVEGSKFCTALMATEDDENSPTREQKVGYSKKPKDLGEEQAIQRISQHKFVRCPDNSEELACIVHLMLTVDLCITQP
jgi:hypothetical protein